MKYPGKIKKTTSFIKLMVTLAAIGILIHYTADKNVLAQDTASAVSNMICINPQAKEVKINNEFSLEVSVNNISDLFAVPFYLTYDPKILQFVSAKEGPFLGQDGNSTTFLFSNDINRGRVIVGLTRLGKVKGVSGSGSIMVINFKAVGIGNTSIGFDKASAKKVTEDTEPQSFPVTFRGAQVNVK
ncbi:MAG: cohesin domain-containing protein [bacterium]|nr:cohesin domain-containing protein [bacterium]